MQTKIFRWKAVGPLLLLAILLIVLWLLFADLLLRQTSEEAGTELLGTQVTVGALDLREREVSVDLGRLEIADPFDSMSNLVEADRIYIELNPEALAERKFVVERLAVSGMRFGTRRETPADPVEDGGFAAGLVAAMREWREQFDVPLLSLTPIDTIRQIALDPTQLTTIRQAQALAARTDSTRRALEEGFETLDLEPVIDSARGLAARLSQTSPAELGVAGVRDAVEDVRRTLARIDSARQRIEALERNAGEGIALLGRGVEAVDEARQQDYAFARSLLRLPSFDAPDVSNALFGDVSIDRFQQALYWAEIAREHMPPGLLPRQEAGPDRLRASGVTVNFPKEREYPEFLLRSGALDFVLETDGPLAGSYAVAVQGLTTAPALYGRPAQVTIQRAAEGSGVASFRAGAVIDHVGEPIRDSALAVATGVDLPAFDLPELPFRLEPGRGRTSLMFRLEGREITGRWSIASDQVTFRADTAAPLSDVERVIYDVLQGLDALEVSAELSGTIAQPRLAVRSNLADALGARLEQMLGEQLAAAEARVRAEVDRLVETHVEPVRREALAAQNQVESRIAEQRARLDQAERQLKAELERLTSPVEDLIDLPDIDL